MPKTITKRKVNFTLNINWQVLDINKPPTCSGIYAVKDKNTDVFLYIGKAKNICSRIKCKQHPIQVTKDISITFSYLYIYAEEKDISWLERYLIREHQPDWNGGTAFGSSQQTAGVCCNLASDYLYSTTVNPIHMKMLVDSFA